MKERTVRNKLLQCCRAKGALVIPLVQGNGYPDTLIVPHQKRAFFVETKSGRTGHTMQDNQKDMKEAQERRGHCVEEVNKLDQETVERLNYLMGGENGQEIA